MNRIVPAMLLLMLTMPVSGATLNVSDLPGGFIQGIIDGEFTVVFDDDLNIRSQFETDGFAAYPYLTNAGVHFLLEYNLAPGSRCCGSAATERSGSVFLGVALTYDLGTDGHEIDLYFDGLIPDGGTSNLFFSNLPQTTVTLDASAIASGRGVYMTSGEPDYINSGNMSFGDLFSVNHPFICIECSMVFALDLVYLDYSTGFLAFNPDDPRALLINAYDSYDTTPYGFDLNIAVQAVPLPGALLLFASALAGLRLTASRIRVGGMFRRPYC